MNVTPEVPSERVAIIVFLLCKGRKFTTMEVAELCGVTRRGAYAIMARISRVVPLAPVDGQWGECVILDGSEDETEQDVPPDMLQWLQMFTNSRSARGAIGEQTHEP